MIHYKTYIVMFALSALGSAALTPVAMKVAAAIGAVDLPNARKIHQKPMPRLGGFAVFFGFLLPWAGLYLLRNQVSFIFQEYEKLFAGLIAGTTAMFSLGVYDDSKGANPAMKLAVQAFTALCLYVAGYRIVSVSIPFGGALELGWFALPVTMFWIVGVTNAINLLDGIDGLVSGVTFITAMSLAVINVMSGNVLLALLTLCLAGACLGFLPFNHYPARIFLGDSGSLTIGMVLACISVLTLFRFAPYQGTASSLITVPFLLFGIPIFDTIRVMLKRFRRGVSIFQPDKTHVHHRLLSMGMSQKHAAWLLYFVAAALGGTSIFLTRLEAGQQKQLSVLFAGLAAGGYLLWRLHLREVFLPEEDQRK
ncbi:MAG TPA: MraY family glycosyltransferase [Candidatus Limnocylindria bacterium]|jgi:UDP-GlcNAc:undecaprenyl-phosphate GlcNAc-1-phosphate transferase|nr:MraY family glycosyltransferase [Candidatus Limnocylindria bacterium]